VDGEPYVSLSLLILGGERILLTKTVF